MYILAENISEITSHLSVMTAILDLAFVQHVTYLGILQYFL